MQADWTLSPSQLNEYVRKQLAGDPILRGLRLRGEISGLKRAASGHVYFALKDDQARVSCALFRQYACRLNFDPAEGMRVVVRGSASLFVRDGSFQVYAEDMKPDGVGELYRQFELLKERLSREGLFDPAIKRPLPYLPKCVGIATSISGAVFHDILRVGLRRYPGMRFVLAPCAVQGTGAAKEIAGAIERLSRSGLCDVILCGRGGGSMEDLWAFNEEIVARAMRASRAPVVSCVGHETDFTIADFAADARAATPSAAAEMAIPVRDQLLRDLRAQEAALSARAFDSLSKRRLALDALRSSHAFRKPAESWLAPRNQALGQLRTRADAAFEKRKALWETSVERENLRMRAAYEKALSHKKAELALQEKALLAMEPDAPIRRGYALVAREGRILSDAGALSPGETISVRMRDGRIEASVERIDR